MNQPTPPANIIAPSKLEFHLRGGLAAGFYAPGQILVRLIVLLAFLALGQWKSSAQDNYEIQVYGSETVASNQTMIELHSNFTAEGRKTIVNGVFPTDHAEHETVEITHGFNDWFETGFYLFTSARSGEGWQWVGDHIRPRVRVPESWEWPVGLSLSTEVGYQQRTFSEDTWTLELRPILDKQWGRWYFSLNPAFERSLNGYNSARGFEFAPNVKLSYDFTKVITAGVEYYGSLGPVMGLDTFGNQEHYIFPALDLNFSKNWEFNFGVGFGVTHSSDHLIVKMIIGRRF